MNKKGFTVIELLASFSIAMTILIVLFNVVIMMKDNIADINTKSNMLVSKDNLAYNINKKFSEKDISSITMCEDGVKCYLFTYSDDSTDKLVYNTDSITFNNYTFDITSDITVNEPTVTEHYDSMNSTTYDGYFIINIPIQFDKKDYSIKAIKYINTNSIMVDFTEYIYDNNGNKYNPVEYLESTGTQYIDTGVVAASDLKIKINFEALDYNNNSIFGCRDNNVSYSILLDFYDNGIQYGTFVRFSTGMVNVKVGNLEINKKYEIFLSSDGIYINNEKISNINTESFSDSQAGITLFSYINTSTRENYFYGKARVYSFVINKNNNILRNYIPVIDSTSRPCLFDKVSKECYYNQGTGEFLYG